MISTRVLLFSFIFNSSITLLFFITSKIGISFLPLQGHVLLKITSFLNDLSPLLPPFTFPVLLLGHELAWSGLNTFQELQPLYEWVTNPETGKLNDGILNMVKEKGQSLIYKSQDQIKSLRWKNFNGIHSSSSSSSSATMTVPTSSTPHSSSSSLTSNLFNPFKLKQSSMNGDYLPFTGFLVGPVKVEDLTEEIQEKRVFLANQEYYLIIFQVLFKFYPLL